MIIVLPITVNHLELLSCSTYYNELPVPISMKYLFQWSNDYS